LEDERSWKSPGLQPHRHQKKKKKPQNQKKQSLKKKRKEIEEGEKLPTPVFRISYI